MNRLGIEFISAFGMPPVDYINLAADLGCAYISMGLTSFDVNPHGFAPFNLLEDPALQRETKAALRDRGITISLGEGLNLRPGAQASDYAKAQDIFAELGTERINVVGLSPDWEWTIEEIGKTVEMASTRGMKTTTEFIPGLPIGSFEAGARVAQEINNPHFSLVLDTMHFCRSGGTIEQIRAHSPDLIGYVQIADAPLVSTFESYFDEAKTQRCRPNEGELPLYEILEAIPQDVICSLEIPLLAEANAGQDGYTRLRPAVETARAMLHRIASKA